MTVNPTCSAENKATCSTSTACSAKNKATCSIAEAKTVSNPTCSVANSVANKATCDATAKATCSKESKAPCTVKTNALHVHSDNSDIVQVAAHSGKFNTLLAAAKAAGIVDVLKAPGPITIFAPTDEAFAKLPKGTVESLLKPENKEQLLSILTYHVVPGRLQLRLSTATLQGSNISIRSETPIMINNAKVLVSDINATNGLIHAIDTVLLPQKSTTQPVEKVAKVK
ncbi:MAG: fasciclin domain-containing protein [Phycisphaerae bacterium]|nr:fasciclin domain-containing protein [Phycisphaerae bacterium]